MIAVLAFAALLLLPGLLVVRAPWTAVGPLSLAFWALSAWWPPLTFLSRGRVVVAVVLASATLALLRLLPRHEVPPPAGWPASLPEHLPQAAASPPGGLPTPRLASASSLFVLVAALVLFAPAPLWRHAPGDRLAFQTTAARLLLWRDGIPRSAEPLLPLSPFGAHAPAIATLAADLSGLSGIDPGRSVLLVLLAAVGLTLIGLFALEATWIPPSGAAAGSLCGLALALWLRSFEVWGAGEALLCLAFVLPALALLVGRTSRSSAVAAGMLIGAGLLAHPLLAAVACGAAAVAGGWAVVRLRGSSARSTVSTRGILAVTAATGLGAFGLWPAVRALSVREAQQILVPERLAAVVAFLAGCACVGLGAVLGRALTRDGSWRLAAACATLGAALLTASVFRWVDRGQLGPERLAALAFLAETTSPLDRVCAPPAELPWVPALAGRAAGEPGPWIPAIYRDEWDRRDRRVCVTAHAIP